MKILITILFLSLLSSSCSKDHRVAPIDDLVVRDGLYYKKFSDVPFSGKVTGSYEGTLNYGKKEGEWVDYWTNGQLYSKGNYKNGKKEGAWVFYWDNGQLMRKGNYKNGKREGAWVEYENYGTLDRERSGTYKNGVKIRKD